MMYFLFKEKSRTCMAAVLLCLFLALASATQAEEAAAVDPYQERFLLLFNEARQDPLAMATRLGLDPEEIRNSLPGMAGIFAEGLPPIVMSGLLSGVAAAHTGDMIEKKYYATVSPDGTTLVSRMTAAGYVPVFAGETLGLLTFVNFVSPDRAVDHIFANMFRDELKAERTEPRYILNPDITDTGISFQSGSMVINSRQVNFYLTTCDFSTGMANELVFPLMEQQLTQLINQSRRKGLIVGESLQISLNELAIFRPHLYDSLANGLPPLTTRDILAGAAGDHVEDMAAHDYFQRLSPDGLYPEDRLLDAGYEAGFGGEIIARVRAADYPVPEAAVQALFEQMVGRELDPAWEGERIILAEDNRDIGVGITLARMSTGNGLETFYLAVCDFGHGDLDRLPRIMGIVYSDDNTDGLYTPGEGVAGRAVICYGAELHLQSDDTGGIDSEVLPGEYLLILHSQTEDLEFAEIFVGNDNLWFDFDISKM